VEHFLLFDPTLFQDKTLALLITSPANPLARIFFQLQPLRLNGIYRDVSSIVLSRRIIINTSQDINLHAAVDRGIDLFRVLVETDNILTDLVGMARRSAAQSV
jgi:hypothetical protein